MYRGLQIKEKVLLWIYKEQKEVIIMSIDFMEVMRKIIGIEELKDFSKVEERLENIGEGFIFQHNKPTHVIMTLEYYEKIKSSIENQTKSETQTEGLEILLSKIGKKIFVDYYEVFKEDNEPERALEAEGFTLASRRSRSSGARAVFKNNLQIAALNNIMNSDRVDTETSIKAKKLLEYEKNGIVIEENRDDTEGNYQVKIGKMMKGILTKTIQNGVLSKEELLNLQDAEYSKKIMNLNFPVLKVLAEGQSVDEAKRDAKGYNRYYDLLVPYQGKQYLICSQWVDNLHQESVKKWIRKIMARILVNAVEKIPKGEKFEVKNILANYWSYIDDVTRRMIGKDFKNDYVLKCDSVKFVDNENVGRYVKL